jgi:hypothetical protein
MSGAFLEWALEAFSGYVALDELYEGRYCVLSAVDNRPYKRIWYEVLDHDPNHDDIRAFLGRLKKALTARELELKGITTDGSALYPEPIREVFGEVPHQICTFYVIAERMESFFAEKTFLGINHIPSLNLNAIQTMLSLRLLAFHAVDNFRHDLGAAYQNQTPELIHREFIDGVQGRVQWRGNVIKIHVYGFEHEAAAAALLRNLDTKLEHAGVDPRIPWLGNRRLRFTFHELSDRKGYTRTGLNYC